MTKNKILITGANGLLGKSATEFFSDRAEVFAIVRSVPEHKLPNVNYIAIDLGGNLWGERDLPEDIDVIFHLAQSQKFREFPDEAMDVFNVNIHSTAKLLDYARKADVKKFVYASSGGVYGAGKHAFVENSPITPSGKLGYYLGSKLCSEIIVETYSQIMTVGILRFFFMYGKEQKREMLIPRLVDRIKSGEPISIQGENGISINPIHVSDAVAVLNSMIDLDYSCTMNIGGPDILSIREIAEIIGKELGVEPRFEQMAGDVNNLIGDIGSMKKNLISPKISLKQGIKDLI